MNQLVLLELSIKAHNPTGEKLRIKISRRAQHCCPLARFALWHAPKDSDGVAAMKSHRSTNAAAAMGLPWALPRRQDNLR